MVAIVWTNPLIQDYLGGFRVGVNLTHTLSYFSPGERRMIAEPAAPENARRVAQTAQSYFANMEKRDIDPRDELLFRMIVGHRRLFFHRPAQSSLLSLETHESRRGASFGILHVVDTSAPSYLTSHFSVSFSGLAWALGLEDFLNTSVDAESHSILKKALRGVGISDKAPVEEYLGGDRHYLATPLNELVPGGPKVKVSFNRRPEGIENLGTAQLDFLVRDINPLGPYLPGGVLELWRLAARVMAG